MTASTALACHGAGKNWSYDLTMPLLGLVWHP